MYKYIVLYNPLSCRGKGLEDAKQLETILKNAEIEYVDATGVGDPVQYALELPKETRVIFTGGDGTLNHIINLVDIDTLDRELYYYPGGTGNDFLNDLGKSKSCDPFPINEYCKGLPTVTVNGITRKFINGIGCGLDGFCCEENDRLKELGKKKSYVLIAAEGVAGKYSPCNAKVTVDGVTREYKNVWMAPTMIGRYYGGGVNICPNQDRKNPEHTVTNAMFYGIGRLKGARMFLAVSKGHGPDYPDVIDYRVGKHVIVELDRPVPLQIDGETVRNVTRYEVFSAED